MARAKQVTEAEWLTPNGRRLVTHARRIASDRKQRLFGCGFCRLHWDRLADDRLREAITIFENYADKPKPAPGRLHAAELIAQANWNQPDTDLDTDLWQCVHAASFSVANGASEAIPLLRSRPVQNAILRDLFGNPFRPVGFLPSWRTSAAVGVARSMYEARDFAAMPILADALQDAGCEDSTILSHCRGDGPHVRGCWVVDLVLGKS